MTKKHFIALADMIKSVNNGEALGVDSFSQAQIKAIAWFCKNQNNQFDFDRWLAYIAGTCGKNGGKVKQVVNS